MTSERRTPIGLAAGTAATRARELERARFDAYTLGFTQGWAKAIEMLSESIHESISAEAFADGVQAGRREAAADHDSIWREGFEDGLRESAAIVKKLRARVAELEAPRCEDA
jgi:hypothetical protein